MSYPGLTPYEKGKRNGRIKGLKEGLKEGRKLTLEENVAALLRQGIVSPEQIADAFEMPLGKVRRIKKKFKV